MIKELKLHPPTPSSPLPLSAATFPSLPSPLKSRSTSEFVTVEEGGIYETLRNHQPGAHSIFKAAVTVSSAVAVGWGVDSLHITRRETAPPKIPTLAPNATSESQEGHVPEDILCVLSYPKCQYGYSCRVREQGASTTLASNAASIHGVGRLNTATAYATSAATSIYATFIGSLQL